MQPGKGLGKTTFLIKGEILLETKQKLPCAALQTQVYLSN